jgi:hypothetical protein
MFMMMIIIIPLSSRSVSPIFLCFVTTATAQLDTASSLLDELVQCTTVSIRGY